MNSYQQINQIFQCFQLIICLFGVVGNVLSICVFSRKSLKNYSYSIYSRALSLSHTALLFHILLHSVFGMLHSTREIDFIGSFFCTIRDYPGYVIGTISILMLTLISIDRLISIVYRNRYKITKKSWFQATAISTIIIYSLIVNFKVALNYRYEVIREGNSSKPICYLPLEVQNFQSWIVLAHFFLVNLLFNNMLNVKIISCILRSRKKIRRTKQSQSFMKNRKFAVNAIGLNLTSFVARMPIAVGILLSNYLNIHPDQAQMTFTIGLTISTLDHSLTIFINIMFNSLFYREFLNMFGVKNEKPTSLSRSRNQSNRSNRSI